LFESIGVDNPFNPKKQEIHMKTALVALGGNALIEKGQKGTFTEQLTNAHKASRHIVSLVKQGYKIAVTHGNGPQVGHILYQQEKGYPTAPRLPLFACVAESQGMIGYMLQKSLTFNLHTTGLDTPVVTVLTRVLVNKRDRAFAKPTKPIGLKGRKGYRVVPSPEPVEIVEAATIKNMLNYAVVISCGGGGIPVIKKKGLWGIDAVIDKDLASEKLAEAIDADIFLILTNVDAVYRNFPKKKRERRIHKMTVRMAERLLLEGHFPPGSMGPKILASIRFLKHNPKGKVIITSFNFLEKALAGKKGTVIVHE
jgi:carbamate kinase